MTKENQKHLTLTDAPKKKEYEEFIAAILQSTGFYVEKNIKKYDEQQLLELDIIATEYREEDKPKKKIIEVKSGDWGPTEIFKMRGWMEYLNAEEGFIISLQSQKSIGGLSRLGSDLNIGIQVAKNSDDITFSDLSSSIKLRQWERADLRVWRYSYWLERCIYTQLHKLAKDESQDRYRTTKSYLFNATNEAFFQSCPIERTEKLYDIFKNDPHLVARWYNESIIGEWNEECSIPRDTYVHDFIKNNLSELAIPAFAEYLLRLGIIKSASEYILENGLNANDIPVAAEAMALKRQLTIPKTTNALITSLLSSGITHNFPIFFQWFFWYFGGFIIEDRRDEELKLMAKKTGAPILEIEHFIALFSTLFPETGLRKYGKTNISRLPFFPAPYFGIGAFVRRIHYGNGNWGKSGLSNDVIADLRAAEGSTYNTLISW